jgi:3-hydroxy-3-methylglutaryl CoA synthase
MAGIVSYGAYIPRVRLDRKAIMKSMGWFAPNLYGVAQGERSMCNWDEDSMTMAVAASQDCLKGTDKTQIDAVYMGSTTFPFLDRQNAGILKAALNLKDDISSGDFSSSLKAGATALLAGLEGLKGGEKKQILVCATDRRRAKAASTQEMYFGDGAASLLLGHENVLAQCIGSYSLSVDFIDHYRGNGVEFDYNWEERWIRDEGYLKIFPKAIAGLLNKVGLKKEGVSKFIFPCAIPRAHAMIGKQFGAAPEQLASPLYESCGECGAAHPLIMLAHELENARPGDKLMVAGYGQGVDAILLEVTENITRFSGRGRFSACMNRKKVETAYTKFLQYNDMLETEMGARAEIDNRTALSTLWRNRKLVLGFVGGKCKACGTPQIPRERVCVNPECGAIDSQEDYEFSSQTAKVLTFTADNLAASLDPPAIYGMVQFEGGGRMMMDFTDCNMDEIEVGVPMKLSFRKKYHDPKRGFTGYFWKATPIATAKP